VKLISFTPPWPRLSVTDALVKHGGLPPEMEAMVRLQETPTEDVLRALAEASGIAVKPAWGWAKLLAELFEARAEGQLIQPTFVTDFPAELSPLAKARPDDPRYAQRFELYVGGLEVANAYTELNDPREQRVRLEAQAKALHNPPGMYGIVYRGLKNANATPWAYMLFVMGGDYLTKDGKSAMNAPEWVKTMDLYAGMLRRYGPPGVVNFNWYECSSAFMQGQVGLYYDF